MAYNDVRYMSEQARPSRTVGLVYGTTDMQLDPSFLNLQNAKGPCLVMREGSGCDRGQWGWDGFHIGVTIKGFCLRAKCAQGKA